MSSTRALMLSMVSGWLGRGGGIRPPCSLDQGRGNEQHPGSDAFNGGLAGGGKGEGGGMYALP